MHLIFSRLVGPTGHVVAVEAHPDTFRCLKKTIEANGLSNVTAVSVAAADEDGTVGISCGSSYQSSGIMTGERTVQVEMRRLDDVLGELGVVHPSLVKMNIEGAETMALRGMCRTLRDVPHVVISCHDFIADTGHAPELRKSNDVEKLLRDAGYGLRRRLDDPRPWVQYYFYGSKAIASDQVAG